MIPSSNSSFTKPSTAGSPDLNN